MSEYIFFSSVMWKMTFLLSTFYFSITFPLLKWEDSFGCNSRTCSKRIQGEGGAKTSFLHQQKPTIKEWSKQASTSYKIPPIAPLLAAPILLKSSLGSKPWQQGRISWDLAYNLTTHCWHILVENIPIIFCIHAG